MTTLVGNLKEITVSAWMQVKHLCACARSYVNHFRYDLDPFFIPFHLYFLNFCINVFFYDIQCIHGSRLSELLLTYYLCSLDLLRRINAKAKEKCLRQITKLFIPKYIALTMAKNTNINSETSSSSMPLSNTSSSKFLSDIAVPTIHLPLNVLNFFNFKISSSHQYLRRSSQLPPSPPCPHLHLHPSSRPLR